jgi:hypothetical protein
LAGGDRQQHRERGELRDRAFEHADHRRRQKRSQQVDLQPWQAFAHGERARRQRTFVGTHADHRLHVGRQILAHGFHQFLSCEHADEMKIHVDDRQHVHVMLTELLENFLARIERVHEDLHRCRQLRERYGGVGEDQALYVDARMQCHVVVQQEQVRKAVDLLPAQLGQGLAGGRTLVERERGRVHQLADGVFGILEQHAEFVGSGFRHPVEPRRAPVVRHLAQQAERGADVHVLQDIRRQCIG